jgi:hypothetical protein
MGQTIGLTHFHLHAYLYNLLDILSANLPNDINNIKSG